MHYSNDIDITVTEENNKQLGIYELVDAVSSKYEIVFKYMDWTNSHLSLAHFSDTQSTVESRKGLAFVRLLPH